MVINEGMAVTSVGQGQLSAAYDGLTDIVGCTMPVTWGFLFAKFAAASSGGGGGVMARIGIGGHWLVAAAFRVFAGLAIRSIEPKAEKDQ